MRTPVHIDLAPDVCAALEDHQDAVVFGLLDDLHGVRSRKQAGSAGRQAISFRIVFRIVQRVVIVNSRRPGLKRDPWLGGASAALASAGGRPTASGARFCGRGSDDNVPRAHILNVGNVPDAFFAWNSTQVDRAIGQPRSRL